VTAPERLRDKKKAPALPLAEKGKAEMRTKETTLNPMRTGGANPIRSLLQGGKGGEKKKRP
jgi:hypothetical protein